MENPFTYGVIVAGDYFTDREEELAELKLDVRSGQNVAIISPRRYGKTSLVFRAIQDLAKEGVLIAYVDLMLSESKAEFANAFANALYDGLEAPFDRAWKKAGDFFSRLSLRPRFTLDDSGKPVVELAMAAAERDVDGIIRDLLALPDKIAQERKKRVAIVMDEFQEVMGIDKHLPAEMRSIFQKQGEVSHIFLGSKRHIMREVFTGSNQPMYRMAKVMSLNVISRKVFEDFLRDRFASTAMEPTAGAISRILDITGCHPHDTQQLAYFTWSRAFLSGTPVTVESVDRAFQRVLEVEDDRYAVLWEDLSRSQRLVLKALASAGDTGIYSEEYRRQHGLGAPTTVQAALAALRKKDMVESSPGGYAISDRLLSAWILRYRRGLEPPLRPVRE